MRELTKISKIPIPTVIPVMVWPKYILSSSPVTLIKPKPRNIVPTTPRNIKLLLGAGKIRIVKSKYTGKGRRKANTFTKTVMSIRFDDLGFACFLLIKQALPSKRMHQS